MSTTRTEVYDEIITPIKITYTPTGEQYILDFSRESALFAQERGFDPTQISPKNNLIIIPELFFYSLRKNHRSIAKNQVEKLINKLFPDGVPDTVISRLIELYAQAISLNVIADGEDETKNVQTVVDF